MCRRPGDAKTLPATRGRCADVFAAARPRMPVVLACNSVSGGGHACAHPRPTEGTNRANHYRVDRARRRRLTGEQEPKRDQEAEHLLADALARQNLVDRQRSGAGHRSWCNAAYAAERDQLLGAAVGAPDSQKSMLKAAGLQISVELTCDKHRQVSALRLFQVGKVGSKTPPRFGRTRRWIAQSA